MSFPLLTRSQEEEILQDCREKAQEGWKLLQEEPSFPHIQDCIYFVNGAHHVVESNALSKTYVNRVRKIHNEIAAILTDVRPIGSYTSANPASKKGAEVLSRCNKLWWRKQRVDRVLRQALALSGVGGSGYVMFTWDKDQEDIIPVAVDPRDVIPIDPVLGTSSIQDWRGVCIRTRLSEDAAKEQFPDHRDAFDESSGNSWFGPEVSRISGTIRRVATSFWNTMLGKKRRQDPPGVEIMRIYLKDDEVNPGPDVQPMGEPGTNWYYEVKPGEKLWPRGKLVICTPDRVLRVLPNPYWHGKFPIVRFTLVDAPWTLTGLSIVQDLVSLQHSLNESVRGLDDARNKILRRDVIADRRALSADALKKIDTRLPGGTYHVDTTLTGSEGFRFGEPPELGPYYLQHMQWVLDQMDDVSGVKGIQAFQQLKQMPSKDTIQEFLQALSPLLKDMARSLEVSVLEMADLMMYNFFQYYSTTKRLDMLGEDGLAPEDFEGDIGSMAPAAGEDESTEEVVKRTARQFRFSVAQNTFLNITNMGDRMLKFQLWSRGGLSTYSMWEAMDIPNIGPETGPDEPARMVAERKIGLLQGPPPELVQAQLMAQIAQAQAAVAQMGSMMQGQPGAPQGGAPPAESTEEVGGGAPRPPGRPPSGMEAPTIQSKDGGTRMVVSQTGG